MSKDFMLKLFFCLFVFCLFSLEKREPPQPFKISVIIPCHPNHFYLLDPLFTAYKEQSSLPDQIVVSLSEAQLVPEPMMHALEEKKWPFEVLIVKSHLAQLPGKNRNCACAATNGDVIICQDADDLPHPQRVEIVRYLFENFKIQHLLHQWLPSNGTFPTIAMQGLEKQCIKYRTYEFIKTSYVHNGSACFLREVYDQVRWRPNLSIDEDALFNRHASAFFPEHYFLEQPLICYRGELSTFDLNGDRQKSR